MEALKPLARELDVHFNPTRSTHQHIVDVMRQALSRGGTVTAEAFSSINRAILSGHCAGRP